ncbi:MAG: hypothetical protein P1U64_08010 [Alcanivoracaceae bacterium]|nr:hypothetical protein [Alcanivoracaceae bacterium]
MRNDRSRQRHHAAWLLLAALLSGCVATKTDTDTGVVSTPDNALGVPLRLSPLVRPDPARRGVVVSIPLARGRLQDARQLQVLAPDGAALPVIRRTRLQWPASATLPASPRVVEVRIDGPVGGLLGNTLYLSISEQPTADSENAIAAGLPAAAVLPAQWNIDAHLFGRALPLGPGSHWFDQALTGYTPTALNQLPAAVKPEHYINLDKPAPWLFDRAGNLFRVYFRSAHPGMFAAAEKASRDYANAISKDGYFALKPGDLKYVYTQPLLYRWMLFAEENRAGQIRRMADTAMGWPADGRHAGFWTERHTAYALQALVNAWELTGEARYQQRIDALLDGLLAMSAATGANGKLYNCPAHTLRAHEGNNSDTPVCSPWMMALLGQTLDYYYRLTGEPRAAQLLSRFHQYLLDDGLYRVPADDPNTHLRGMTLPWYLASSAFEFTDNGPYGDLEHTCNVAGLLLRSAAVRAQQETLPDDHARALHGLMTSCQKNMGMWHRPGADVQYGKPVWRLSPPRKYNWWFGSTHELTWLLRQQPFAE